MVRDYRQKGKKWTPAKVTSRTGPLMYDLKTSDGGHWHRHIDQIVNTGVAADKTMNDSAENIELPCIPETIETNVQPPEQAHDSIPQRRYPQRNRKTPDRLTYH